MLTVAAATPVTTPEPSTVAIKSLSLVHEPTPPASDNVIVAPVHTTDGPEIGAAFAFTANVAIEEHPDTV